MSMNYWLSKIEERKKYAEGMNSISENSSEEENVTLEQISEAILTNDKLHIRAKLFYISIYKSCFFVDQVFQPFVKLISYMFSYRMSDFFAAIFINQYDIAPISYSHLYKLLIQLPLKEKETILNKMDLSMTTMNGILTAIENRTEADFVSILENEPKDLTNICKQLQVYNILFSFIDLFNANIEQLDISTTEDMSCFFETLSDEAYRISSEKKEIDMVEKMTNQAFLDIRDVNEYLHIVQEVLTYNENDLVEKWDEFDKFLRISKNRPNFLIKLLKSLFVYFCFLLDKIFQYVYLSKDELSNLNKILYENKDFEDIIRLADRYIEGKHRFEEKNNSVTEEILDFQIPNDFFSNKTYTADSKEDEWIFFINLDATDNNIKKVQALQKFINNLAGYGYIEDSFHVKATFLYRITGRKLPNTENRTILWKDEMEKQNNLLYLIKNFYSDFTGIPKGNLKSGTYKKSEALFGVSYDNIKNCSGRADAAINTKFREFYDQLVNEIK